MKSAVASLWLLLGLVALCRATWSCTELDSSNSGAKYYDCPDVNSIIQGALGEVVPGVGRRKEVTYAQAFRELKRLVEGAGEELSLFLVGGPIRDALRNVTPKDIDISMTVPGKKVPTAFVGNLISANEKKYGRKAVLKGPNKHKNLNFLMLLGESHNGIDATSTAKNVLASNSWRDFSVNSLYWEEKTQVVIDGTGYGIEDNSVKRLRMAAFGEGEDTIEAWCPLQRRHNAVDCPTKIQRYFHMRVKGFFPEDATRQFVMTRMKQYFEDEGGMRDTFISVFVRRLLLGTLSSEMSHEKRVNRYKAVLHAFVEDYLAVHYDLTKGSQAREKMEARKDVEALFHRYISPSFFEKEQRRRKVCFVPSYGAPIPGLRCRLNRSSREEKSRWMQADMDESDYAYCTSKTDYEMDICTFKNVDDRDEDTLAENMLSEKPTCNDAISYALIRSESLDDKTLRSMQSLATSDSEYGLDMQRSWKSTVDGWTQQLSDHLWEYEGIKTISRIAAYRIAIHLHEYESYLVEEEWESPPKFKESKIAGSAGYLERDGTLDWPKVQRLANEGNSREQLAFFWNIMRDSAVSNIVSKEEFRNYAYKLRSREKRDGSCIVPKEVYDPCKEKTSVKAVRPGWSFLAYKCKQFPGQCKDVRFSRSAKTSTQIFERDEVHPPLSEKEIEQCGTKSGVQWTVGSLMYGVTNNNQRSYFDGPEQQGFKLQASSNGFTSMAGPSGSTAWMMSFAEGTLSFSRDELQMLRLALISFMLPSKGHSLYEVMVGSDGFGIDVGEYDPVQWLTFIAELHSPDAVLDVPPTLQFQWRQRKGKLLPRSLRVVDNHTQRMFARESFTEFLRTDADLDPYSYLSESVSGMHDQIHELITFDGAESTLDDNDDDDLDAIERLLGIDSCDKVTEEISWAKTLSKSLLARNFLSKCVGQARWIKYLDLFAEGASKMRNSRVKFIRQFDGVVKRCKRKHKDRFFRVTTCVQKWANDRNIAPAGKEDIIRAIEKLLDMGGLHLGECTDILSDMQKKIRKVEQNFAKCGVVKSKNILKGSTTLSAAVHLTFHREVLDIVKDEDRCTYPFETTESRSRADDVMFAYRTKAGELEDRCDNSKDARVRAILATYRSMFKITPRYVGSIHLIAGGSSADEGVDKRIGVVISDYDSPIGRMCLVRPFGDPAHFAELQLCSELGTPMNGVVSKDRSLLEDIPRPGSMIGVIGKSTSFKVKGATVCGVETISGTNEARLQVIVGDSHAEWAKYTGHVASSIVTLSSSLVALTGAQYTSFKRNRHLSKMQVSKIVDCYYERVHRENFQHFLPSRIVKIVMKMNGDVFVGCQAVPLDEAGYEPNVVDWAETPGKERVGTLLQVLPDPGRRVVTTLGLSFDDEVIDHYKYSEQGRRLEVDDYVQHRYSRSSGTFQVQQFEAEWDDSRNGLQDVIVRAQISRTPEKWVDEEDLIKVRLVRRRRRRPRRNE